MASLAGYVDSKCQYTNAASVNVVLTSIQEQVLMVLQDGRTIVVSCH